jgi:CheY-like chemotaxis protein
MRLLIAEDCPISCEIVRRILRGQNHDITFVADGVEAWETLRRAPAEVDAVILDLVMPGMGGFEVLAYMRESADLRDKPVILCTALGDRLSVIHAARLAVEHYIVKPFTKAVLLEKLAAVSAARDGRGKRDLERAACAELGIDAQAYGELASRLVRDVREWTELSKACCSAGALRKIHLRADALRGAALSLGAPELARELDRAARCVEELDLDRGPFPCELIVSELGAVAGPVAEALARFASRFSA